MNENKKQNKPSVLLIDCDDKKGLINSVTGVLLRHKCNIISNREYVDQAKNKFYMRTEFEGDINDKEDLLEEMRTILPEGSHVAMPNGDKKKIVILATSEHHCLAELLIRNAFNDLNIEVVAVVSNHENLRELVEKFSVPFRYVSNGSTERSEHEREIEKNVTEFSPDYIVLAKYMRILSPEFVTKFKNKIINIHHSFLPAFIGANPYRQAFDRGVKIIGATAHFVTDELDMGPIIIQDIAPINHSHSVDAMKKAGHDIEKIALVKALRYVCDDKVFINGNKTIVFA